MRRHVRFFLGAGALLSAITFLSYTQAQVLPGSRPTQGTNAAPLGFHDISPEEKVRRASTAPSQVAQWALRDVGKIYGVASGTPQVVLSRHVRASELPTLGIPFGAVVDESIGKIHDVGFRLSAGYPVAHSDG